MAHFHYALKASMARGRSGAFCFGGDSESDSGTYTTTQTTSNTAYQDKRAVSSDAAISLSGSGNAIDRSTQSITSFADSSNKSTNFADASNRSTNFADSSNRSTTFTDTSNRSTNISTTDFGSVKAAVGLGGQMTTQAFGVSGQAIKGAIDSLQMTSKNNLDLVSQAFGMAKGAAANSMDSSAQVLGFAAKAVDTTQQAMAQAKDGGQAKMVMYALAAIAVIGVAFAVRR